jgi:hypothetical protein
MTLMNHPGDSFQAHTIRHKPEAAPATILCCPVKGSYHPVTMKCLKEYGRESVVLEELDPDWPEDLKYGMRNAIAQYWTGEKDLIHVDHDMVFIWDNLRDMVNCDSLWCSCPYLAFGQQINAPLGFTKFSAELQRKVDMDKVFYEHDNCVTTDTMIGCYGDWWGFEWHLVGAISALRLFPCTHLNVLNDHSLWGLKAPKGEAVMTIDWHTAEGRAKLASYLREERGWKLEGEPA